MFICQSEDFLDGVVASVHNQGERSFGLSLPAVTVTSDVGSTVTLGGIVMNLCFYRGYEQARTSLLLHLVRYPRSVFPLIDNKHIKRRPYDDTALSSHSRPNPPTKLGLAIQKGWSNGVLAQERPQK